MRPFEIRPPSGSAGWLNANTMDDGGKWFIGQPLALKLLT